MLRTLSPLSAPFSPRPQAYRQQTVISTEAKRLHRLAQRRDPQFARGHHASHTSFQASQRAEGSLSPSPLLLPLPLFAFRRHPERSAKRAVEGPPYWFLPLPLPLLLPFWLSFRAQRGTRFSLAQQAPVLALARS
jgi:hypothetical protein